MTPPFRAVPGVTLGGGTRGVARPTGLGAENELMTREEGFGDAPPRRHPRAGGTATSATSPGWWHRGGVATGRVCPQSREGVPWCHFGVRDEDLGSPHELCHPPHPPQAGCWGHGDSSGWRQGAGGSRPHQPPIDVLGWFLGCPRSPWGVPGCPQGVPAGQGTRLGTARWWQWWWHIQGDTGTPKPGWGDNGTPKPPPRGQWDPETPAGVTMGPPNPAEGTVAPLIPSGVTMRPPNPHRSDSGTPKPG